jgi:hypothetical protein
MMDHGFSDEDPADPVLRAAEEKLELALLVKAA